MRERYLEMFDRIAIDNLNGDKFKNGKLTPEGDSDPSVFSTEYNREGIQVGTAIALLVKTAGSHKATKADRPISFRNFWGKTKRADLLADSSGYEDIIRPKRWDSLSCRPRSQSDIRTGLCCLRSFQHPSLA